MTTSCIELNEIHFDALREIGNIGAGNAATSLSVILNKMVSISVPDVNIKGFDEAVRMIGNPDDVCVAVRVNFDGDFSGLILFVLSISDAKSIMDVLVADEENESATELSRMEISGIQEIGNILASSYMGSIAELTNTKINLSIPYVAIGMVDEILAAPISEYSLSNDKVIFIEESFITNDQCSHSHAIMFTQIEMLAQLMKQLGLEL